MFTDTVIVEEGGTVAEALGQVLIKRIVDKLYIVFFLSAALYNGFYENFFVLCF